MRNQDKCSVCWEAVDKDLKFFKCKHNICETCFDEWVSAKEYMYPSITCPECRATLDETNEMLMELHGLIIE